MLYDKLRMIFTSLFKRFMKASIVDNLKTGSDIIKMDVTKLQNHLPVKEVDIGFGARRTLSSDMSSESLNFRAEAKLIMVTLCTKMQERSPLKYSMVKYISCLNPTNIWANTKECVKRFDSMCEVLLEANRITYLVQILRIGPGNY